MSDRIARLGSRYHDWIRAHPDAADHFGGAIEDLLTDAGVTYDRVVARVKEWPSLKAKARKRNPDGTPLYPDPWTDIHDVIGVRVITFQSTEIPLVIGVLRQWFTVDRSVDKTAETRVAGGFGYGSHHLVLRIDEKSADIEELAEYQGVVFEVQVRTVLQHAWAEFEHDIRYKRGQEELDPRVDRAFALAAGLIELADQQFDQIITLQNPDTSPAEDIEFTAETLPGVLAMLLGNRFPRSRSENYRWLEEMLNANGITTVPELEGLLNDADIDAIHKAVNYRFRPGQIRLIDDLLLRRFGQDHIKRTGGSGARPNQRRQQMAARLKRMRAEQIVPRKKDKHG
ncbi:GTP pyrophosphokinase [Corynebacterium alimapuense]|uniref:GTP pyrophosphokinase n=1 Tax=Corynebacterium alimapuense TaxID=1576874 RepID=A0A3M8K8K4_9CORY|nr:GTP pyrophosphokinase family protein [Corynebacterium alimapuense]RNE49466.1 GTP pyrophosphokinase [Corynebacterium alimapuense]